MSGTDTSETHRTVSFEQRMSEAEALMWNVEKDPWLNPSGAMITILDQPVDFDGFRRRVASAVADTPRLRERVQPGLGRLNPPTWVPDEEFEIDHHVRHIALPAPGSTRQLMDLCTHLYEDQLDRTRPLWVFYVIDGLEDGKGALFSKLHHTIADGKTAIRLSERYMEFERHTETPPEVDLGRIVREAAAEAAARTEADDAQDATNGASDVAGSAIGAATGLLRRQLDLTKKVVGEVAGWGADIDRPVELGEKAVGQARSIYENLGVGEDEQPGSPLWATRSRHRHLEELSIPLDDAKAVGKRLGGTINDVFVIGAVAGAIDYHARRGVVLDELNVSFVISTRTRSTRGGNAFTPTPVRVPARQVPIDELFATIHALIEEKKSASSGGSAASLGSLARVANMLPTSVVTKMARDRAGTLDFATSNLRGAPFPVYVSGGKVLQNVIMGPVAGTAFNLTTMSYDGQLDMGLFCDPAAVEDPADLRDCLVRAYADLLALTTD
ncbi:MAG: wax ester/triacylglycerol synthase domain-containing protein [Actinomycetota bacterium]